MLDDPALLEPARAAMAGAPAVDEEVAGAGTSGEAWSGGRRSATAAWRLAFEAVAAAYHGLEDPYQRARAADVEEVGARVLEELARLQQQPAGERHPANAGARPLAPTTRLAGFHRPRRPG